MAIGRWALISATHAATSWPGLHVLEHMRILSVVSQDSHSDYLSY